MVKDFCYTPAGTSPKAILSKVKTKSPHSSSDKRRAILQWGTKITFYKN